MFNNDKKKQAVELISACTPEELFWLQGYIEGILTNRTGSLNIASSVASTPRNLTIVYGTETGNTKVVAQQLEKTAKSQGIKVKNLSLSKFTIKDLQALSNPLIILTSTHGEGEPPITAKAFFKAIKETASVDLSKLSYAVLGLGDSSYQQFCGCAKEIDAFLVSNKATSFHAYTPLDVDYAKHTPSWIDAVLKSYDAVMGSAVASVAVSASSPSASAEIISSVGYSRLEPIKATVKVNIDLNDRGSSKRTHHIELELSQPVSYTVGDALGVILPTDKDGNFPTPRLYSIASSPLVTENEAHLLVSHAWHSLPDGTKGYGIASDYLVNLPVGTEIQVYIHRNNMFRLPSDEADIIMVGAGTGIAPFRGFVQERSERGATGRNWLFFGEQHAHCDFFYQAEWQDLVSNETLTHIDLAFSRDQAQKIYVQDRMKEKGAELIEWLNNGAVLYVCGRKDPMSKDIDETLIGLLEQYKRLSRTDAEAQLLDWLDEGRYLKDVY